MVVILSRSNDSDTTLVDLVEHDERLKRHTLGHSHTHGCADGCARSPTGTDRLVVVDHVQSGSNNNDTDSNSNSSSSSNSKYRNVELSHYGQAEQYEPLEQYQDAGYDGEYTAGYGSYEDERSALQQQHQQQDQQHHHHHLYHQQQQQQHQQQQQKQLFRSTCLHVDCETTSSGTCSSGSSGVEPGMQTLSLPATVATVPAAAAAADAVPPLDEYLAAYSLPYRQLTEASKQRLCVEQKAVSFRSDTCDDRIVYVDQREVAHATDDQTEWLVTAHATTCHMLAVRSLSSSSSSSSLSTLTHVDGTAYDECVRDIVQRHVDFHHSQKLVSSDCGSDNDNDNDCNDGNGNGSGHDIGCDCDCDCDCIGGGDVDDGLSSETSDDVIEMDVHIVGGFVDGCRSSDASSESQSISSWLLQTLGGLSNEYSDVVRMKLKTCLVSSGNTCWTGGPMVRGLALRTSTGDVLAVSDVSSDLCGPALYLRQARLWSSGDVDGGSGSDSDRDSSSNIDGGNDHGNDNDNDHRGSCSDGLRLTVIHDVDIRVHVHVDSCDSSAMLSTASVLTASPLSCRLSSASTSTSATASTSTSSVMTIEPFCYEWTDDLECLYRLPSDEHLLHYTSTSPQYEDASVFCAMVRGTLRYMREHACSDVFASGSGGRPLRFRRSLEGAGGKASNAWELLVVDGTDDSHRDNACRSSMCVPSEVSTTTAAAATTV